MVTRHPQKCVGSPLIVDLYFARHLNDQGRVSLCLLGSKGQVACDPDASESKKGLFELLRYICVCIFARSKPA